MLFVLSVSKIAVCALLFVLPVSQTVCVVLFVLLVSQTVFCCAVCVAGNAVPVCGLLQQGGHHRSGYQRRQVREGGWGGGEGRDED